MKVAFEAHVLENQSLYSSTQDTGPPQLLLLHGVSFGYGTYCDEGFLCQSAEDQREVFRFCDCTRCGRDNTRRTVATSLPVIFVDD